MPTDMKTLVTEAKKRIKEIAPKEADQQIEKGAVVIDVREPHEHESGHVPGAINIPRGVLEIKVPDHEATKDPNTPIRVYCGSGGRAALSADRLQELGYTDVASIEGGFKGWCDAGLPAEYAGGDEEE